MNEQITLLYFPSALALGALHALEPGHAKTLTAAYLIGTKGTKRDAILLGLSVAVTHSFVVVALSAAALWLGTEAITDRASHWLQVGSGVFVILLGCWMLWKRWPRKSPSTEAHHHGAPDPVHVNCSLAEGVLSIIDTSVGERFHFQSERLNPGVLMRVKISRMNGAIEELSLSPSDAGGSISAIAPEEPHEFKAVFELISGEKIETIPFEMREPAGHEEHGHHDHGHAHHDHEGSHDDMDEDEHARAHAATLPDYVKAGTRPSAWQIVAFGAAGGMIPCPASVTVMLLALSVGQAGMGMLTVLGFSIGLAITLVGIGLLVVAGITRLEGTERFSWFPGHAPVISACMVIVSGFAALAFAH